MDTNGNLYQLSIKQTNEGQVATVRINDRNLDIMSNILKEVIANSNSVVK